jgi:hypothetical protein
MIPQHSHPLQTLISNNVVAEFEPIEAPAPELEQIGVRAAKKAKPTKSVTAAESEETWIAHLENELEAVVWDAMSPFHAAIGAVEAACGGSDARRHYRWIDGANTIQARACPVVKGNKTLAEFNRNNRHLDFKLIRALVTAYSTPTPKENFEAKVVTPLEESGKMITADLKIGSKFEMIGPVIYVPDADEIEFRNQLVAQGQPDLLLTPDWVWCALTKPTFQFVLQHTTFGAFEMAAAELNQLPPFRGKSKIDLLKDLIVSDDVSGRFCEYVAQIITKHNGGNAYLGRMQNNGGGATFNISVGLKTRVLNANWRMGAKIWFSTCVYYAPHGRNFAEEKRAVQDRIRALEPIVYNRLPGFDDTQEHATFYTRARALIIALRLPDFERNAMITVLRQSRIFVFNQILLNSLTPDQRTEYERLQTELKRINMQINAERDELELLKKRLIIIAREEACTPDMVLRASPEDD